MKNKLRINLRMLLTILLLTIFVVPTIAADSAGADAGSSMDAAFQKDCKKYEAAIKLNPNDYNSYISYGEALVYQAKRKNGAEAYELYDKACEKYEAAVKIKPDDTAAYYAWAFA